MLIEMTCGIAGTRIAAVELLFRNSNSQDTKIEYMALVSVHNKSGTVV